MPKLRVPGGARLGSIKEGDVAAAAAAAAVDRVAADKQALRRLIRPGAPDSAGGDPLGLPTEAATVTPRSDLLLPLCLPFSAPSKISLEKQTLFLVNFSLGQSWF